MLHTHFVSSNKNNQVSLTVKDFIPASLLCGRNLYDTAFSSSSRFFQPSVLGTSMLENSPENDNDNEVDASSTIILPFDQLTFAEIQTYLEGSVGSRPWPVSSESASSESFSFWRLSASVSEARSSQSALQMTANPTRTSGSPI